MRVETENIIVNDKIIGKLYTLTVLVFALGIELMVFNNIAAVNINFRFYNFGFSISFTSRYKTNEKKELADEKKT